MSIKMIIKRKIPKGMEGRLLPLLLELRSQAINHPGYISGETLRNINDPEDFVVISTWQSEDAWKSWTSNKKKIELTEEIDSLLGKTSSYEMYMHG